jgi:adenosylcobinamide amidohydrolase
MAIVYLSPIGNSVIPFLNANGAPNANGFLSTYLAGTTTPSATYTTSAGTVNLFAVLKALLSDPRQIPALIRTARESNAAFRTLLRCRNILGLGLAGPDGSELALDM